MATLRMQSEGSEERVITLDADETVMGRAADNAITIDDPAASSRHCVILRKENCYTLRDLNSTNGSYLNGAQVTEVPLAPGDVLTIGSVRMLLEGDDIETGTTLPPATGPQDTIRTGPIRQKTPPEFGVRKNRSGMWITIGIVIALALGALLYMFISRLIG
ncbi:MAG: FHA domain-containing protein [Verrucomicrobia bacterium]|nr:FHA domain-containing protein [Verrucomicrobiota bacterium]MBT7066775.1 FHA domain-containing protein [Verrucomicrobiota bacterium]MBT7700921.1 FHA domain-containing protein [Verrucomicrobiota bacterium]